MDTLSSMAMRPLSLLRLVLFVAALSTSAGAAALPSAAIAPLAGDDPDARSQAVAEIADSGDPNASRILAALSDGRLFFEDGAASFVENDQAYRVEDGAKTAMPKGEAIIANNRLRGEADAALSGLRLSHPDLEVRLEAARELASSADEGQQALLTKALAGKPDPRVRALLQTALARIEIQAEDPARRARAVDTLAESDDPQVRGLLVDRLRDESNPDLRKAIGAAVTAIDARIARSEYLGRVLTGISLGSVLLLAALGLAITYGVMGVINMAHGELLMVGAYATWVTQDLFRRYLPELQDWYVVASIPVAFAAAALVGLLIERLVVRHLYGRPLETLLATFGVSLVLAQGARTLFGAQNVELSNPSWLSGGLELSSTLVLPWNRIGIVIFAVGVLAVVALLLVRTRLGLYVRAVTQNRRMAACMGVPTGRTDALAFGLGAGIAGLGGLALSQFTNVGPDMGQAYIVDSFMVVVLGGVGQLAGCVIAAFGLGIVSKFLEGWAGAVIAKILVLVFIIVFIQRRPQGLFALKGRQVEA